MAMVRDLPGIEIHGPMNRKSGHYPGAKKSPGIEIHGYGPWISIPGLFFAPG
jgi:hypothetical protein